MRKQRILFLIIFFLSAVTMATGRVAIAARQQADPPLEYKLKAAFLLNFAKFVTWPEQAATDGEQRFTMCVLGKNPFGPSLAAVKSRTVGKRKISLHYIDDMKQAAGCRLLFVSRSEKDRLAEISEALQGKAVLTVSDIEGFLSSGGIIEFVIRDNRLSFKINLAQAKKQGLHINASLLSLATEVIR